MEAESAAQHPIVGVSQEWCLARHFKDGAGVWDEWREQPWKAIRKTLHAGRKVKVVFWRSSCTQFVWSLEWDVGGGGRGLCLKCKLKQFLKVLEHYAKKLKQWTEGMILSSSIVNEFVIQTNKSQSSRGHFELLCQDNRYKPRLSKESQDWSWRHCSSGWDLLSKHKSLSSNPSIEKKGKENQEQRVIRAVL
jgi:hypothetical protein